MMPQMEESQENRPSPGGTRPARASQSLGWLTLLGNAYFVLSVIVLHALQPELSPYDQAVSYYVHGVDGWLLTTGLLAWGIGSLALVAGLARNLHGRGQATALWTLGIWSVGVVLGGVFRADPAGHWNAPPSIAGMIHGNAAMVAFIALPIAALLFARRFRQAPEWHRIGRVSYALAVAAVVSLVAFFMSLAPAIVLDGPPKLLGLTERILLGVYTAWLCVAAVGLMQQAGKSALPVMKA